MKPDYTTLTASKKRFAALSRQMGFRADTPQAYALWKDRLRAELRRLTGMDTHSPAPLEPVEIQRERMDGYTRVKMVIRTEADVRMPFYVLKPDSGKERYPAALAPHGHSSDGKNAVVGRADGAALRGSIDHYHYAYGVELVKRGFIVFAPDARGFGERREARIAEDTDENRMASSCYTLLMRALPLGQTVVGQWTFDLTRLIDYALTRDDVQQEGVACCGLSGGGMQTLWLAAMDERVRAAVVSGYFYGYEESLLEMAENCACNYAPHLYEKADMGDIAALIAPRGLFIESGDQDELNGESGLKNVDTQFEIAERAYALLGARHMLSRAVFHGPHRFDGAESLTWLQSLMNPLR